MEIQIQKYVRVWCVASIKLLHRRIKFTQYCNDFDTNS